MVHAQFISFNKKKTENTLCPSEVKKKEKKKRD